jgi:hypothetical protein
MKNDKKRATPARLIYQSGMGGAIIGHLLGWLLNEWYNTYESYMNHCAVQAIVWAIVGGIVGAFAGAVLAKLDIGNRGNRDDGEKNHE